MAKIRTVKPELFRHADLYEAEIQSGLPLRLAFIALFSCCDREGRFRWEPRSLKLDTLPYDTIDFELVLNALWEAGFIKKYSAHTKYFGYIPSWHLHQSINKHEPASRLPDPERCEHESYLSVQSTQMHMHARATHKYDSSGLAAKNVTLSASDHFVSDQPVLDSLYESEKALNTPNAKTSDSVKQETSKNNDPNQSDTNEQFTLHVPSPEMHMHARAMHEPASEINMPASLEVEMEVEREREVEMEQVNTGRPKANPHIVAPTRRRSAVDEDIRSIFDFWKTTFRYPQAILDPKRRRWIRLALQSGYSVAQLCDAISGCSKTPHNLGDNERGQRYDGLHVILRDSDQIERFIQNHNNPPRPPSPTDKLLKANVDAATHWLNKKNLTGVKP